MVKGRKGLTNQISFVNLHPQIKYMATYWREKENSTAKLTPVGYFLNSDYETLETWNFH